jgi:hypothetical protein
MGFAQMSLVAVALGSLLTIGLHVRTWTLIIAAATTLALISRLLHNGRKQP